MRPESTLREYYANLLRGLQRQFLSKVLVMPSDGFRFYRTTNFMDGSNGVYRWHYRSNPNDGYGPWQLTGTMLYGWWTFLDTPEIRDAYKGFATELPMSAGERKTYLGPWSGLSDDEARLLVGLAAGFTSITPELKHLAITDSQRNAWASTSKRRLQRQIWLSGDLQDHAYTLMIPVHSAFAAQESTWREAVTRHMSAWMESDIARTQGGLLDRLHAFFLISRFLVLANGRVATAVTRGLHSQLLGIVTHLWEGENGPISNYGWGEPRFPNFKSYLGWKLQLIPPWERLWAPNAAE